MRQNIGNDNYSQSVAIVPPIFSQYDAVLNDSSKTFTAPTNELWKLCHAHVVYVSSGAAGDRQIEVVITDSDGNEIMSVSAGAVQAASLTRHYAFLQGVYHETGFTAGEIQVPVPIDLYIMPGGTITFHDSAAIAAAADDMTVSFQYMKYTV